MVNDARRIRVIKWNARKPDMMLAFRWGKCLSINWRWRRDGMEGKLLQGYRGVHGQHGHLRGGRHGRNWIGQESYPGTGHNFARWTNSERPQYELVNSLTWPVIAYRAAGGCIWKETTKEYDKQLKRGATQECYKYVGRRIGQNELPWKSLHKQCVCSRWNMCCRNCAQEENGKAGGRMQNTNPIKKCARAFLEEI